jgi:hypothetical protein
MIRPERSILIIGGAVLALIVIAVVAVLAFGSPSEEEFPEGTPERALQDYFRALDARDTERAYNMLSDRARLGLSLREFTERTSFFSTDVRDTRIRVRSVSIDGERATVDLEIERIDHSGLTIDRWSYERVAPLVQEDGAWKLDEFLGYL